MQPVRRPSGDPIADRRFAYAMALAADGDHAAAAELIEQALERAPDWPEGWAALAEACERAGDAAGAIAALAHAAALDPTGRLGAGLNLVRLRGDAAPAAPPEAYVRDLFDAYSADFEDALVGRLRYRAPDLIAEALRQSGQSRVACALDLGCGTGLMAPLLRPFADWIGGIDLSPAMVDEARRKQVYDRLEVAGIVAALTGDSWPAPGLVAAADVFCYLGDLEPICAAAARLALPGARLAFSVERIEGVGFRLRDSLRYGHSAGYIRATLSSTGWRLQSLTEAPLRLDRGVPVAGLVVVAEL